MSLSADDIGIIAAYSGDAYKAINDYLRQDNSGDPMIEEQIVRLDRAIASNPAPATVTVYRGIGETFAADLESRGLAVGDIIQDKGFLSTSRHRDIAAAFMRSSAGMLLAIHVPVGGKALDIAALSAYPGEAEIMLARGARLRVAGYDPVADILELELLCDE